MKSFNLSKFKALMDDVFDEIVIWDRDSRLLYINKAAYRHYGRRPEELIGKTLDELKDTQQLWTPSSLPHVFKEKSTFMQRQKLFLGFTVTTISVPVLDVNGEVEYIIQTAREDDGQLFHWVSAIPDAPETHQSSGFICQSNAMKHVLGQAERISKTNAAVMILGETGTGKSMLADYIHKSGSRADGPFISVNMASVNASLFESEFFGYVPGAFTGAKKDGQIGFLEAADGGTLFMDEIGEMPYEQQAKLLHVLQNGEFTPVGATKAKTVNVRVICATNQNLQKLVEAHKFREDLYHRLNVMEIEIPPLRQRTEDISVLSSHYLNRFNQKYNKLTRMTVEAMQIIMNAPWRGNVRELSNVIERAVLTNTTGRIAPEDLPPYLFSMSEQDDYSKYIHTVSSFDKAIEDTERRLVTELYRETGSSRKLAARLKISQSKANRLIQKYVETPNVPENDMAGAQTGK